MRLQRTSLPPVRTPDVEGPINEAFLQEFRPVAVAIALKVLRNMEDAEDAVQNAYVKAWRSRNTFDARSSPKTWMHQIVSHAAIDFIRRGLARRLDKQVELPVDLAAHSDLEKEIMCRDLLQRVLISAAGMSVAIRRGFELAMEEESGLCSTDKVRKNRARAELRRRWIN